MFGGIIMKKMEFMQTTLLVLATLLLIVMNVFTFSSITLNVLRMLLALCWVAVMIVSVITHKVTIRKTEL